MNPVTAFEQKIHQTIARYGLLRAEDRVLAGVSGGADSVALLLVLKAMNVSLAVAHLNHGLRGPESDGDQDFVENLAAKFGVPCFTRRAELGDGNIEVAGRAARRTFFQDLTREHGFTRIALGHNRDDRVETFMLHLVRGAGSGGLVSMSPVNGAVVRPLIESSRAEIEEFLKTSGQDWRTDATNADISFSRNRMRHEGLPMLASLFNSRVVEAISRTASLMSDEDQWMTAMARQWLEANRDSQGLDVGALRAASPALARRVVREALRQAGSRLTDVTLDHIESIRTLLDSGKSGKVIPLPGGIIVAREFERLVFLEGGYEGAGFSYGMSVPGTLRVEELRTVFSARILTIDDAAAASVQGSDRVFVDGDRIGPYVTIRNWKPGDYYRPAGWPAGKLKKLFLKARVPRSQRHRWPVIAQEAAIIWVVSFPVSREFLPDGRSKKIVAFEALPD